MFVEAGCKDKARALQKFSHEHSIPPAEIAYIGDDVNDLGAVAIAGVSAAPADAQAIVRESVTMILGNSGGRGAVREFVEMLLLAKSEQ